MSTIEDLLRAIDAVWTPRINEQRILLRVLGQTALYLQTGYERGTKDGDILETHQVSGDVRERLEALAGSGTKVAKKHGIYLDIVGASIPLLPRDPLWHSYPMGLSHFDVVMLDVADVLVSKLIRYISTDRDDIRAMVDGDFVEHATLHPRFKDVIERYQFDARADRLPGMIDRFNEIERDLFLVEESEFELHPSVFQ